MAHRVTATSAVVASATVGCFSLFGTILAFPVVVNGVGDGPYGAWLFLYAIATLTYFADAGIGAAVVHFTARYRGGDALRSPEYLLSNGLAWIVVAVAVAMPTYTVIATRYLGRGSVAAVLTPEERTGLLIIGLGVVMSVVLRPFTESLVGLGHYVVERRTQFVAVVTRIVLSMVVANRTHDIIAVAVVEALSQLLPSAMAAFLVVRVYAVEPRLRYVSRGAVAGMLSYSGKATLTSAIGAMILQIPTLFIGVLGGPRAVAEFNAAFRVYTGLRQLLAWVTDPFRSAFSRSFVKSETAGRGTYAFMLGTLTVTIGGSCCLALSLHPLLSYWLPKGMDPEAVSSAVWILIFAIVMNSIHMPLIPLGDSSGNPGAFLVPQATWLVLAAGCAWGGWHIAGTAGVASALALPLMLVEVMYLRRARRVLGISLRAWVGRVLAPALALIGPSGLLAVGAWTAARSLGSFPLVASAASVVVFSGSFALAIWLYRDWGPVKAVRELATLRM